MRKFDYKNWESVRNIVLFGYGRQGRKAYETLHRDFVIIAVVDNDKNKNGQKHENTPILSVENADKILNMYKIVVTTSERYYSEISKQLCERGLIEGLDFVMYQDFIVEWYFKAQKKLFIPKVDIPVTSFCSLKCKNCHVFIPYWKKSFNFDLKVLEDTIDNFFKYVDYVADVDILGGEPLLYPYIVKLISYIGQKYREKIGYFGIITNGTIVPNDDLIEVLDKYSVHVSISDYGSSIKNGKVKEIREVLDKKCVDYHINTDIAWFAFGRPDEPERYNTKMVKKHFELCNTIYHIIYNNKFYMCGTAWAAGMSGLFDCEEDEAIDLEDMDYDRIQKKIYDYCRGITEKEALSYCSRCGGFGADNTTIVKTAEQIFDVYQ